MVRTSRPRKVPGTAKQSSDPNLRSGYELHFSIEPGGGRRDCHFTYGTLDQIFFLLRAEFRREKDGSGGPASIDEDRSLLAFDGEQATALDLAGFISARHKSRRILLADPGLKEFCASLSYDEALKLTYEVDFKGIEKALPKPIHPPLLPGETLDSGRIYGYETGEDWPYPYDEEPPPLPRVKSKSGFVAWGSAPNSRFEELESLRNVTQVAQLALGASRAKGFPKNAYFDVVRTAREGLMLSDNPMTEGHHVVSRRLRDALKPLLGASKVEFLPVKLKSPGGGWANRAPHFHSEKYYLMNPIDLVDVIDAKASGGKFDTKNKTQLVSTSKPLVLGAVDPEAMMFRPKNWRRRIFVRADVAAKLEKLGFLQLDLIPLR